MTPGGSSYDWPDSLDAVSVSIFVALIVVLPALGYMLMVLDVRSYLRSLRRQMIRVMDHLELPEWARRQTPRCLTALGLRLPCTEEEVKQAYRKKVKHLHPDRGGDKRKFLKLQAYFEESLAVAREFDASRAGET
jgi:hypothetical protein